MASAIFRAYRSVPRIMGFRVVFLYFFGMVFCVFFFAWKHGSMAGGVAEEMCQPHPKSLAWLLQPQRVRILGARLLGGRESAGIVIFFLRHHFRN